MSFERRKGEERRKKREQIRERGKKERRGKGNVYNNDYFKLLTLCS